ncbi:hypothetical protein EYF80_022817 [Liparis tanakae]|uniref:Uncharacterized protein n=1 Tax=Liparis tanakae TaxID=230148 RepID=A0A4Z2HMV0_9TELE|nr:hypothetical protein EYF80_022817 [Liparis tanakae]
MASTTSMIRCSAESVPMVMSVPQKSLSMEPTMPTMWSSELTRVASSSIRPEGGRRERGGEIGFSSVTSPLTSRRSALTLLQQLVQQAAPLLPEQVGAGEAAVAADHAQVGDAAAHQVVRGLQAALALAELLAAGAADDRAALEGRRRAPREITSRALVCNCYAIHEETVEVATSRTREPERKERRPGTQPALLTAERPPEPEGGGGPR